MQILTYSLTNYVALFSIQNTDFRATDIFRGVLALRDERIEFNDRCLLSFLSSSDNWKLHTARDSSL